MSMLVPQEWAARALCAQPGQNPEMWFAGTGSPDFKKAKKLCNEKCPVRAQCLAYALSLPPAHTSVGLWGGFTRHYLNNLRSKYRKDGVL